MVALLADVKKVMKIDDTAKGSLTQFWDLFHRDFLRAQRFQMLISSLFEDIYVSS